jgi:phenylpropionate dioxygenase-like ring-hydroxylating dioxygenase large terminal subunit
MDASKSRGFDVAIMAGCLIRRAAALRCLASPAGGKALERFRQPWYPVEERYGLVFAYLGPLAEKPILPRYELLEDLENGTYETFVDGHHLISSDPQPDHNWLQKAENTMDPFHVWVLHNNMGREQFHHYFTTRPQVKWEYTDVGVRCVAERQVEGNVVHRINDLVFPALAVIGDPLAHQFDRSVVFNWFVPVDDYSMKDFVIIRAKPDVVSKVRTGEYARRLFPKLWSEMSTEDHQREPSDYEAQASQGKITLHSEENLVSSDTGISMYRRLLRRAIRDVGEGRSPFNLSFDESAPSIKLVGGNYLAGKAA